MAEPENPEPYRTEDTGNSFLIISGIIVLALVLAFLIFTDDQRRDSVFLAIVLGIPLVAALVFAVLGVRKKRQLKK